MTRKKTEEERQSHSPTPSEIKSAITEYLRNGNVFDNQIDSILDSFDKLGPKEQRDIFSYTVYCAKAGVDILTREQDEKTEQNQLRKIVRLGPPPHVCSGIGCMICVRTASWKD
jgi:hypothetical protein